MFWLCLMRKLEMFRMFCPVKLLLIADFKALLTGMNYYSSKIYEKRLKYFLRKKRFFESIFKHKIGYLCQKHFAR